MYGEDFMTSITSSTFLKPWNIYPAVPAIVVGKLGATKVGVVAVVIVVGAVALLIFNTVTMFLPYFWTQKPPSENRFISLKWSLRIKICVCKKDIYKRLYMI
jgi:hypothetical protein